MKNIPLLTIMSDNITQQEQKDQVVIDDLRKRYNKKIDESVAKKAKNNKVHAEDAIAAAEILEEIYTKSNQKFLITSICSEVVRDYKTRGDLLYHHVNDYLPPKYKNPRQVEAAKKRWEQIKSEIDPMQDLTSDGKIDYNKPLEQISEDDLEKLPEDTIRETLKRAKKVVNRIEDKAEERGIAVINYSSQGEGWSPGFKKKYSKVSTIDPPELTDEESRKYLTDCIDEHIESLQEYKKDVLRFPPQFKEHMVKWGNGFKQATKLWQQMGDDKYSLHTGGWINVEMYRQIHGKHAAAVWEKTPTVLCVKCSKDVDNDPEAYEQMFADPKSPTGWKCLKCKGTEQMVRALTREQVGDRSDFVLQQAWDCIKWMPHLISAMVVYDEWKKPYNAARKKRLFSILSDLA